MDQTPPDGGPTAFDDPAADRVPGFDRLGRPLRGVDPLSKSNRARLLRKLQAAADAGDVGAQAALVELSLAAEHDTKLRASLAVLRASLDGTDGPA